MDLECEITNQIMKVLTSDDNLVNWTEDYLTLSFTFKTSDWDNLTKFALFKTRGSDTYRIGLVNDTVLVPHEVLTSDYFVFSVYGINSSTLRVTTNQVKVYLANSGYTKTTVPTIPDPSTDIVEEIYIAIATHTHTLDKITDTDTVEMVVTYDDDTTDTFHVVVKE